MKSETRTSNILSISLRKSTTSKMVSLSRRVPLHPDLTRLLSDAIMKVSVVVLQRVYQLLQGSSGTASSVEQDILDVDAHIFIVDAFEMPQWNWSSERSTFER